MPNLGYHHWVAGENCALGESWTVVIDIVNQDGDISESHVGRRTIVSGFNHKEVVVLHFSVQLHLCTDHTNIINTENCIRVKS